MGPKGWARGKVTRKGNWCQGGHTWGYTLTGRESKSNRDCSFWSSSDGKIGGTWKEYWKGACSGRLNRTRKGEGISAWKGNERGGRRNATREEPSHGLIKKRGVRR